MLRNMPKPPDVIALQETWIKDGSKFNFPGYNAISLNRGDRQGGGVATLLRDGIPYNMQVIEHVKYESLLVTIPARKGTSINIFNLYIPPSVDIHSLSSSLHKSFCHSNSIILGDLNAYSVVFGAAYSDKKGRLVESLIDQFGLVALNTGEGTHLTPSGRTTPIDLTICSPTFLAKNMSWSVLDQNMGSDHFPILIKLNEWITYEQSERKVWSLRKAKWDEYQRRANYALSNLPPFTNIETAALLVTEKLKEAASASIPVKNCGRIGLRPVPWWNDECAAAIKARNKALYSLRKEYTTVMSECYREH